MVTGSFQKELLAQILYKVINGYDKILPITSDDLKQWELADKELYLHWVNKYFGAIRKWTTPDIDPLTLLNLSEFEVEV